MSTYAEVFPPGEFLKDELEARNWSQVEFASIIGRPVRTVNEIIAGKRSITPETALQLEASLGTSAELWMNLESQYQLSKVRQPQNTIARKAEIYSKFPVRELAKRGWIDATEDVEVLGHELAKFYAISSLDEEPSLAHAAKKSSYGSVTIHQWSWIFRVQQIASGFVVPKYNKTKLLESLLPLKNLMSAPEEIRHVPRLLNEAGIRFLIVEALPGSKIDGACLWLEGQHPVIALSCRLDRIDNFWFVLRHEIEHLIQEHGKENGLIFDEDISEPGEAATLEEERIANDAASEFGVTEADLKNYIARVNPYIFSREKVLGFSMRLSLHPGIVIGRLHKQMEKRGDASAYRFLREYLVKVRHIVSSSSPTDGWGNVYPV